MKAIRYIFDLFALWFTILILAFIFMAIAAWATGSDTVGVWVLWGTLGYGVIAAIYRTVQFWHELSPRPSHRTEEGV
ncbi:hypothetical protein [Nitratifractor salsuginis]|uniref:hypothetical protein n=1 Tax=Nitratifractor salsuginis TaxID=269261 RepID=UPI0005AB0EE8|nr:hypothetical protein [Nitratifractor salsuginis]